MPVFLLLAALVMAAELPARGGERTSPTPTPAPLPRRGAAREGAVSGMEGFTPTDVLRFEPLLIEGRVQKPQAIHLLTRSAPSFGDLIPEESFLPRILEAVESEPF